MHARARWYLALEREIFEVSDLDILLSVDLFANSIRISQVI